MQIDPAALSRREKYGLITSCVIPRPIGWTSTLSESGTPNLAPFSFFGGVSSDPFLVSLSVGRKRGERKDTAVNLLANREAVIHIPHRPLAESMVQTSANVSPDVDEFDLAQLEKAPSVMVRPPRVAAAAIALEARVHHHLELGNGPVDFFILEVVHVFVDDQYIVAGRTPPKCRPSPVWAVSDTVTRRRSFPLPDPNEQHGVFSTLFGLSAPVSRKSYIIAGFGLMAVKYGLDMGGVYLATSKFLNPLEFLSPLFTTREHLLRGGPNWIAGAMLIWALPFLWIGLTMTFRRALDAGLSPWLSFLFVVPAMNVLLMLGLCFAPSRPDLARARRKQDAGPEVSRSHQIKSAILGTGLGVVFTVGMVGVSALGLKEYGAVLFMATPIIIGATAGYVFNQRRVHGVGPTVAVGALAICLGGLSLLLFALEGAICIFMAAPLAVGVGIVGAVLGREVALRGLDRVAPLVLVVLSLPLLAAAEAEVGTPRLRSVVTEIEVDAPVEVVWQNVIGFGQLPEPPAWYARTGLAFPVRARLEGRGVGAVRHCEFSTGAFVEPITVWEAPRRLAFDVASQPEPMHEWSPYQHVHPPHLDGYINSKRGEFRLTALPGGRTLLSGTTWYTLDILPVAYWSVWSDFAIRKIHEQVLAHVAREASK